MRPVLLIAEAANPEWVSVPLIGWSLARAIAASTPVHLVTQVRNRAAILRAGLVAGRDFTVIDSEKVAAPLYRLGNLIRGGQGVGWTTISAVSTLSYYYFERLVWKQFGAAIRRGDYRLVHRITPLSPTTPSPLAAHCKRAGTPFILGPLNGGVPWPREFAAARRQEREWLSYLRKAYRWMPSYQATLRSAAAIIAGSHSTLSEVPAAVKPKAFYLPENAIDPARFNMRCAPASGPALRACFVGRLVPYKGADMLIEAIQPMAQAGNLQLDIVGDGPMMAQLRSMVAERGLQEAIELHGWVDHGRVQEIMARSQLLLFPSIREFGGGAVLEAMAMGLVPVVVDYGGPGELVTPACGYKIPMATRAQIIGSLRDLVHTICDTPEGLRSRSDAAYQRAHSLFTWRAKARQIAEIYAWAEGQRAQKPQFFASPACSTP